mmetsp:Transcript_4319/g.14198  ORF Transcript_4319/g.14198 Transcript_4319/m.14198 type:complete len:257 (-) Transcript_4319:292-1062(-)
MAAAVALVLLVLPSSIACRACSRSSSSFCARMCCRLFSKSSSSSSDDTTPRDCLRSWLSARSTSRSCLSCVSASRLPASSTSRSASSCLSTWLSACTNWSFSLRWVSTCTVAVVFLRSLSSSSFLSSIFSFSVWFSIFSCSKSIRCSPSAKFSFCLSVSSSLRSTLRRRMLPSRIRSTSVSFNASCSSKLAISLAGMGLPVLEFSEPRKISRLNSRNASRISIALATFSLSRCRVSAEITSYMPSSRRCSSRNSTS